MDNPRLPFMVGLAVLVTIGFVAAVIDFADRQRLSARLEQSASTLGPVGSQSTGVTEPSEGEVEQSAKFSEPELDIRIIPETPLVVDSFPPGDHTALDGWVSYKTRAGHFDGLYSLPDRQSLNADGPVDGPLTVLASGWSGDLQLGLKLTDIILSQCGHIIARTRAVLPRPDVAKSVHPNLDRSGWEAVLYVGDLAFCASPEIKAWAILPGNPVALLPLNGAHLLARPEIYAVDEYRVAAMPTVEPKDVAPPAVSEIEVTGSRVNLRRCGGLDCDRIAQIDGGRHRVHVADHRDGWTLLVFEDRAGWIFDKLYTVVQ